VLQARNSMRSQWNLNGNHVDDNYAYLIGTFLFFYDAVQVSDHECLREICEVLLKDSTGKGYYCLLANPSPKILWSGVVWQRQVVAFLSVCMKASAQDKLPFDVTLELLKRLSSNSLWPAKITKDSELNTEEISGKIIRKLCGDSPTCKLNSSEWIHENGISLFEAIEAELNKGGDALQSPVLAAYLDLGCKILEQLQLNQNQNNDNDNEESDDDILDLFSSIVLTNQFAMRSKIIEELLVGGSAQFWNRVLTSCFRVAQDDNLATLPSTYLLANLIFFQGQKKFHDHETHLFYWNAVAVLVLKISPDSFGVSPLKAKRDVDMDEDEDEDEDVTMIEISSASISSPQALPRRRGRLRRRGRPIFGEKQINGINKQLFDSGLAPEVVKTICILKSPEYVRTEIYNAIDIDTDSSLTWRRVESTVSAFQSICDRWRSNNKKIGVLDMESPAALISRAVAFERKWQRHVLREVWDILLTYLENASTKHRFGEVLASNAKVYSFCASCTLTLFQSLDDEDLFGKHYPFSLDLLRRMSQVTRDVLYQTIWLKQGSDAKAKKRRFFSKNEGKNLESAKTQRQNQHEYDVMTESAVELYDALHERHIRHRIMPDNQWLFPAIPVQELGLSQQGVFNRSLAVSEVLDHGSDNDSDEDQSSKSSKVVTTPELASDRVKIILRKLPQTVPFAQRVLIFNDYVKSDRQRTVGYDGYNPFHNRVRISIRRDHIFEDAFKQLKDKGQDLKNRVQIVFYNDYGLEEAGIDGGGVFKEFLTQFMQQAFDVGTGLWKLTDNQDLYPNPNKRAGSNEDLERYEFTGRMLGKAVYEGILVEPSFATFFLNRLLGKSNRIHDLQSLDPEVYKHLMAIKSIPDPEDLCLNFQVATETGVVALKYNGENLTVTKENTYEYISRMAHFLLNVQFAPQTKAFARGFSDMIPARWLQIFSPRELQLVIGGDDQGYDVDDLRKHSTYGGGYHPSQGYVNDFWEVVGEFNPEQKAQLLHFITSCPRPPLQGFGALNPPICIHRVQITRDIDRLPTASTCVNLLKLPQYSNKDVLRTKLLYSITQAAGFELS